MATENSSNSHYNNIFNKKNIEYKLDGINVKLPYVNDEEITLKKNQIIFTSINNVFQKLLDNDLYNEAMIKKNIDTETIGAPTYIPNINNLSNVVELHKKLILSGENGISVVHKEIEDVANTLTGPFLGTLSSYVKVNKIDFINGKFIACTENGLYSSTNKQHWTKEIGNVSCDVVDVCYNYNQLKNNLISSYSYVAVANSVDGNIVFYGYHSSSNTWKDFSNEDALSAFSISNEIANKIFSFKEDSSIYVASKTGGLIGLNLSETNPEFKTLPETARIEVRDMVDLPHDGNDFERYLLATSNGLKQSQKSFGFSGISLQQTVQNIYDVIRYNGEYYIASKSGLIYGNNSLSVKHVQGLNGVPCYALVASSNKMFVGTSNGLAIVTNNSVAANALQGTSITNVEIMGENVFAASNNALYSSGINSLDFQLINAVEIGTDEKILQLKAGINDTLYVLTNKRIIAISVDGSSTKEGFTHFDSSILNNSNVNFGKQVERNEMLFQKDNRYIVAMDVNNVNVAKISVDFSRTIIDAAKKNSSEYYVLDSSKNIWKLERELNSWSIANTEIKASRIEYFNPGDYSQLSNFQGLAFIDDSLKSTKILLDRNSDNTVKRLTFDGDYKDLQVYDNNLYGLKENTDNDALVLFGKSPTNTEAAKNILEVDDDLSIVVAKDCDDGKTSIFATLSNLVVDSNQQYQLAITVNDDSKISSVNDNIVTDIDFISNVPNVIGTDISTILLAYGNVLSIGHVDANNGVHPIISKTFDDDIVGFADICDISNKDNVVNAMNIIATKNGSVSAITAAESFFDKSISSINEHSTIIDAVSNGPEKTFVVVGSNVSNLDSGGIYRYNSIADKTQPNFISSEGSPSVVFSITSCYNDNVLIASSTGKNAIVSSAWNQASETFTPWTPAYNQNMSEETFQTNSGKDLSVDKAAVMFAVLSTASFPTDLNSDASYFAECQNAKKLAVTLNGSYFDPMQISAIYPDVNLSNIYVAAINGTQYRATLSDETLALTVVEGYTSPTIEDLLNRSYINRAVVGGNNSNLSIGYASDSNPSQNIEEAVFKYIDLDLNLSNTITLNNSIDLDVVFANNVSFTGTGNKFFCDDLSIHFEKDSSAQIIAELLFTISGKFSNINGEDEEQQKTFTATSSFVLTLGETGFDCNIQEMLQNEGLAADLYSVENENIVVNGYVRLQGLNGLPTILKYRTTGTVSVNGFVTKEMPVIKESLDGIYYDNVLDARGKTVYGYFFNVNGTNKYLAFDGKEIYAFDGFVSRTVNKNLAFLLIGGSLFYFDLNVEINSTDVVRKTVIDSQSVNKNFYLAKEDLNYSTVRNVLCTSQALFAISQDKKTLYYTTSEVFPKFRTITWPEKTIEQVVANTDYVICLLSDNSIVYGKVNNDSSLTNWGSITDLPIVRSLFISDNVPYIQGVNGLSSIQANSEIAEEEHYDFNDKIVKTYFNDTIKFENKAMLCNFASGAENCFLVKRRCFDFSNDYQSLLTTNNNEPILDIKLIPGKQIAAVLSKAKIYLIDLNSLEKISQDLPISISDFGSIFFKTDENNEDICYILHDSAMSKFKYQLNEETLSLQLTSIYDIPDFLLNNIDSAKLYAYKNYLPVIVSEKSLDEITAENVVNLTPVQEFSTNVNINQLAKDFSFSNLYLNSDDQLFRLITEQESYILTSSNISRGAFADLKGISTTTSDSKIIVWRKRDSSSSVLATILASDFSDDPTVSSYKVFGTTNGYNAIFTTQIGTPNPTIATSSGLFKLTSIVTTAFRENEDDAFANEVNAFVDRNDAILDRMDILRFANEIKCAVSYTIGNASDVFPYNFSINNFNSDYHIIGSIKYLSFINGKYLLASDGTTALVYDSYSKKTFKVSISQLQTINKYYSKIALIKESENHPIIVYGNSLMNFDGFADIQIFSNPTSEYSIIKNNLRDGCTVLKVLNEVPDFLVGTKNGAKYIYNKQITMPFFDSVKDIQINQKVNDIEKIFYKSGNNRYLIAQANQLFEVDSLKPLEFKLLFQFDEDTTILNVYAVQQNEYLIATNVGVYLTNLKYCFVDDMRRFTVQSVYTIINEELRKVIDKHIKEAHQPNSIVSKVNEKADNTLSFISPESKVEEEYDNTLYNSLRVVKNDIIDTIERGGEEGDDESTYVKVGFKNWATARIDTESTYTSDGFVNAFTDPSSSKFFDVSTVPYIVKNYKSGMKEIYIYVPSTATYYINNPRGISNSEYSYMSLNRINVNGTQINNALETACTTLRVYLYNSHFKIKTILAAQCFGNSLPLKIYKDNVNEDDGWKGFFDTVIQPSTLRTLPMTTDKGVNNAEVCTDNLGRVCLDFSVYGTDAQAIRIIAETEP